MPIRQHGDIFERDGGRCQYCRVKLIRFGKVHQSNYYWLDHIIPRCMGGDNSVFNLVASCFGCNVSHNGNLRKKDVFKMTKLNFDKYVDAKGALKMLRENGIFRSVPWLHKKIANKELRSVMHYTSRIFSKVEIKKIIKREGKHAN